MMVLRRYRVLHNNIYSLGVKEAERLYWTRRGAQKVANKLNQQDNGSGIHWGVTDRWGTPV